MRAMLGAIPEPSEAPHLSDAQIERAVNEVFAKHPWGGCMQARVAGAVVTLKGAVYDMRAKDAACVAAENVAGVSDVIDKLIWIDGMSGTCIFPEELNGRRRWISSKTEHRTGLAAPPKQPVSAALPRS